MSEERSAKLKLKRKKCVSTAQGGQEVEVRPQCSSALNLRQDFTGFWFDEIELTAAERIWKQVLSGVYPDLSNAGWGAVPSLPDVRLKMSRKEEERIDSEVFKVGDMNFEWFPLPTALNAEKPCVPEVEDNQQNIGQVKKPSPDTLPENVQQTKSTVLPTQQVGIPVCSEEPKRTTENLPTPHNGSTKDILLPHMSQKSTSENVTKPRTLLKGSSRNVKEPQILQKGSSKNAKELQPSQKGSTKHTKEQQTSQKPKISLWATVTSSKSNKTIQVHKGKEEPEEKPQPSHVITAGASKEETSEGSSRGRKIEESAEVSAGATSSLDKCPICLLSFPKQFSQLDMDSHLAQCLSETTVDIAW